LRQAIKAEYHVAVLPLRADLQVKFNETRAWEWYRTVEGLPYGYVRLTLINFHDFYAFAL